MPLERRRAAAETARPDLETRFRRFRMVVLMPVRGGKETNGNEVTTFQLFPLSHFRRKTENKVAFCFRLFFWIFLRGDLQLYVCGSFSAALGPISSSLMTEMYDAIH